LTVAHVYGHNDFFKNNFTFRRTRAEYTLSTFKAHADRVRAYVEDPSIGIEKVESILDAAHALSLQCRRNLAIKKLDLEADRERLLDAARPREDPFYALHRRRQYQQPDLKKIPPSPEEDLLVFIRDYNPFLAEWEKDLLTIVHEQAQYFIPQIETKIMNEGWASYWHREILNSLELPQALHLEFLVRHNQVVRPIEGGLNPYHLGLKIWEDIRRRYDDPSPEEAREFHRARGEGLNQLFEVRAADRDASFLRRFLTEELMREMDLFQYQAKGNDLVVSEVSGRRSRRR
jgi:stage V sporulation protein R